MPEIASVLFADSVSVVPEMPATVVASLMPSPKARMPVVTPVVSDTETVFCPEAPVAVFAGFTAVNDKVPETTPVLAAERVTVVPKISVILAPVPTFAPATDIPIPRYRESETVIAVAPVAPVAAFVVSGSKEKSTVELTAAVFASDTVRTFPAMLLMVAPVATFGPDAPIPTEMPVVSGTVRVDAPDSPVVVALLEQENGISSVRML